LEEASETKTTKEKERKKRKSKKRFWVLVDLSILCFLFSLLLYRPMRYSRPEPKETNEVSTYWTHELMPEIYNNAQRQVPFEIVIKQDEINEAVASSSWPKFSDGFSFSAPEVFFDPGRIILIGATRLKEVEFIITVAGEPVINENGLLNLHLTKVKVGAVPVTIVSKIIARKMYTKQISEIKVDSDDWRVKILGSLLNDEPFEPIFDAEDKKVRIIKVDITKGELRIGFAPVSGPIRQK
jgi:uncharacterized protein YpmS